MRTETITCRTRETAKRRTPWACRWLKVWGGWIAFESVSDYETAIRQK